MRTLTVLWQRLLNERGRTCPRCGQTGTQVERAVNVLSRRLRPLGITVRARSKGLTRESFDKNPASSNRIWIGGKPLEHWLGAKTGKSRCCGACGTTSCRTLELGARSYAAVPASFIIRAGQRAASSMLVSKNRRKPTSASIRGKAPK